MLEQQWSDRAVGFVIGADMFTEETVLVDDMLVHSNLDLLAYLK